jgi:hypothetical protein
VRKRLASIAADDRRSRGLKYTISGCPSVNDVPFLSNVSRGEALFWPENEALRLALSARAVNGGEETLLLSESFVR